MPLEMKIALGWAILLAVFVIGSEIAGDKRDKRDFPPEPWDPDA